MLLATKMRQRQKRREKINISVVILGLRWFNASPGGHRVWAIHKKHSAGETKPPLWLLCPTDSTGAPPVPSTPRSPRKAPSLGSLWPHLALGRWEWAGQTDVQWCPGLGARGFLHMGQWPFPQTTGWTLRGQLGNVLSSAALPQAGIAHITEYEVGKEKPHFLILSRESVFSKQPVPPGTQGSDWINSWDALPHPTQMV